MQTSFFTLDALSKADLEDLERMEIRCFTFPWARRSIETELSRCANIAARSRDGKLVGYLYYVEVEDELQILNIAVDPEHWGRGIATAMLKELLRRSRARRFSIIVLEVRPSNTKAINLYRKFGFRGTGTRRRYYSDGEDCLIMTLYLGGECTHD